MERQLKPLKYSELPGLSARQMAEHHDVLYAGYVKKTNELRDRLAAADLANVNPTYSDLRELKVEETFALNGVKLHEAYFENLGGPGGMPTGKIAELITRDFGSIDKWLAEFAACGLAARGWVVLAYDLEEQHLYNFIADAHNQGGVWGAVPLLVLDVYEHAYFLDYATARKKYVDAFLANVDWSDVNARLEELICVSPTNKPKNMDVVHSKNIEALAGLLQTGSINDTPRARARGISTKRAKLVPRPTMSSRA